MFTPSVINHLLSGSGNMLVVLPTYADINVMREEIRNSVKLERCNMNRMQTENACLFMYPADFNLSAVIGYSFTSIIIHESIHMNQDQKDQIMSRVRPS